VFTNSDKILTIGLILLAACATSEERKKVNYSMTAKQNYEKGLAELKEENYEEAEHFFTHVKQKFSFSKYAALAELGLADTEFARGNYQSAIDEYKSFQRLHPTHDKVRDGYTTFRVAECYVKDMPEDWAIFPPSYEKDQSSIRDALRELDQVIASYPESSYVKPAKVYRREVLQRLIAHEVYVARFYLDRGHPKAAILRIETALRRYPQSGRETDLLLALGETQLELGLVAKAKQSFLRVANEFQEESARKRANLFLSFIQRRFGAAPSDQPSDS
jgi:outer membrane protein assembly factor BamD